jgi:TonB-linked SusC/RagA family outer membrane protein
MKKEHPRPYRFFSLLLLLIISGNMYAQNITVTGKVTDKTNFPLPGVAVAVKGTTTGTITDANGTYTIVVPADATLFFTFLGMKPQEIPVNGKTVINVQLEDAAQKIEEVQVVSYGVQKKVTVTGAISSVKSVELEQSPNASLSTSLSGKVSGISSYQTSGEPGAEDPEIFIRGKGTYNDPSPLYIVDGVERPFTQLDPSEVESITVLKDASATAVYGIRGGNGVIIVTTKRGSKGKTNISASFSMGLQQPTKLLELADSYTYATMYNEAQLNDGIDPANVTFAPHIIEAFRTNSDPLIFPNTNWPEYVLKRSSKQLKGSVNATGGSDKVKYFVMIGVLNQDGLFHTFDTDYDYNFAYTRWNYRSNIDINVTRTTKLGLTLGGIVGNKNQPNADGGVSNLFLNLYQAVPYAGPGIVGGKWIKANDTYIPGNKREGLSSFYGMGFRNTMNSTLNMDMSINQNLSMVTKGLKFRFKFSYNTRYSHTKNRDSSKAYYEPFFKAHLDPESDLYMKFDVMPEDRTPVLRRIGEDGRLTYNESYTKGRDWYSEIGFDYNRKFNEHEVGALLLYNQSKFYYPQNFTEIPTGLVGLVGRVTYNYATKYLAEVNVGYNGSENFARDHRYGLFPAGSMGWIISQEKFMENISFLNYLKVRASVGLVGNDKYKNERFMYLPGPYELDAGGYSFGVDNPNEAKVAKETTIGNPYVTWETAVKSDLGIDMYVLNSRLKVVFDYFWENRKDILSNKNLLPGILSMNLMPVNIGQTTNKGYEISVKWRETLNEFTYFVNSNVSFSRSKIIYMEEAPKPEPYMYSTGNPIGTPIGYVFDGFFTQEDIDSGNYPDYQFNPKPGDMKYKDLNHDNIIDNKDQMPIGYPHYPEYIFGLTVGFNYKGFNFSMFWNGTTNVERQLSDFYRDAFGPKKDMSLLQYMADGRWTPETANTATYPRLTFTNNQNNVRYSDFFIWDASYIRLKNIEIGYDFKGKVIKALKINSLRLYATGYNLLTFDKLKIVDPEANTGPATKYPIMKIYNFGVKVDF